MNVETHERYFHHIAYNQDNSITWPILPTSTPVYTKIETKKYEERIITLIQHCQHVTSLQQLFQTIPSSSDPSNPSKTKEISLFCIWIDVEPAPDYGHPPFEAISTFFGIWHEHRRGCHRGLHEFYWTPSISKGSSSTTPTTSSTAYILLLNTRETDGRKDSTYKEFKPSYIQTIPTHAFTSIMIPK